MIRNLELNPQKHEIKLSQISLDTGDGISEVNFQFGETDGEQVFTKLELVKIGNWFLSAAKTLTKKPA